MHPGSQTASGVCGLSEAIRFTFCSPTARAIDSVKRASAHGVNGRESYFESGAMNNVRYFVANTKAI